MVVLGRLEYVRRRVLCGVRTRISLTQPLPGRSKVRFVLEESKPRTGLRCFITLALIDFLEKTTWLCVTYDHGHKHSSGDSICDIYFQPPRQVTHAPAGEDGGDEHEEGGDEGEDTSSAQDAAEDPNNSQQEDDFEGTQQTTDYGIPQQEDFPEDFQQTHNAVNLEQEDGGNTHQPEVSDNCPQEGDAEDPLQADEPTASIQQEEDAINLPQEDSYEDPQMAEGASGFSKEIQFCVLEALRRWVDDGGDPEVHAVVVKAACKAVEDTTDSVWPASLHMARQSQAALALAHELDPVRSRRSVALAVKFRKTAKLIEDTMLGAALGLAIPESVRSS
eukprot:TRINITY_DN20239_c0_g4_i1.p1 TRINITY_DN20239_c0_g4~~TRINITY_DN20239_c0_g4_i1.p1  ORF type:complete len:368 (-),score=72.81 TRINITY_DN20239_c0_g4_i1:430-1431(-)